MSATTTGGVAAGRTVGVLAALFAVSVWAAWIPVTRLGVVTSLSPWDVSVLRYGTAGLLLLPVLLLRWRDVPWRKAGALAAMIAGAGVPYILAFGYGLQVANSGQGAVLGPGANSALVAVLAFLVLREVPARSRVIGLAITLLGVGYVIAHDIALGGVRVEGFLLILLASFCWAAYTVASRLLLLDPLTTTAVVSVGNAVLLLPAYFALGGGEALAQVPAADLWLQALYQGVLTAVIAMIAYAHAVQRLGATIAASFTPLSPVLATGFGALLLGDRVDVATAFGLGAVALGVVVASRSARR